MTGEGLAGHFSCKNSLQQEHHGHGNFYLIRSRMSQIGIGIGDTNLHNLEELRIGNFCEILGGGGYV